MRRRWFAHRQAYGPRLWPVWLWSMPLVVVMNLLLLDHLPTIVLVAVDLAFAFGCAYLRWWVWRRRHPILTPEQYAAMRRRTSPWN